MKKIILPEYNTNVIKALLSLKIIDTEIPEPKNNEVLIKVHAAPVNPSDIAFMSGTYNIVKELPAVPGFEGSGIVTEVGRGAEDLLGKKVCFFTQEKEDGSWSEMVCTNRDNIVVLDERMDMDQAACFAINPFTARGLMDIALLHKQKCVIQNAAGGQVAAFIRMIAKDKGIEVINIVRKKETVEKLKSDGAKYVLCEKSPDFNKELKELAGKLNSHLAFDAVAGKATGYLMNAMPKGSEVVVYGGLSNKPVSGVDPLGLIFYNKLISGFNLPEWHENVDPDYFDEASKDLQDKFVTGAYSTTINGSFRFSQIRQALRKYLKDMSAGKVLIKPD